MNCIKQRRVFEIQKKMKQKKDTVEFILVTMSVCLFVCAHDKTDMFHEEKKRSNEIYMRTNSVKVNIAVSLMYFSIAIQFAHNPQAAA